MDNMLNHDSEEVTKEDYKAFLQAFNGYNEADSIDEMRMHNFYSMLMKNKGKFANDPLSMDYMKNHSQMGWGHMSNPNYEKNMQTDYENDANQIREKEDRVVGRNWK